MKGIVRRWFPDKGFGFIEILDAHGGDLFVHASDVRGNPLREQDEVDFDIAEDERARGKKRAENVTGGTGREDSRDRGRRGGGGYYESKRGRSRSRSRGRERSRSRGRGGGGDRGGGGGGNYGAGAGSKEVRPGDWTCADCGANVFASKDSCFKCGAKRADSRGGGRKDSRRR